MLERRLRFTHWLALVGAAGAMSVTTDDASACGGCFHLDQGQEAESSVVVAHRMAVAISTDHTVLWDQVQYAGNPSDFAWVLPIKPGARLELGTSAFFETLEAATQAMVVSPDIHCWPGGDPGGGGDWEGDGPNGDGYYGDNGEYGAYGNEYESGGCCGGSSDAYASGEDGGLFDGGQNGNSGGSGNAGNTGNFGGSSGVEEQPPPVEVVHEATVGPYETVTLSANQEGVLQDWLTDHGYAVDASIEPVIDAYVAEGFDFIAMRLAPGEGVQQMRPVRVVSPGASPALPLRMVAAGTGAEVALTLFVLTEGRWEADNFPNHTIDPTTLTWDVSTSSSNYSMLRDDALQMEDGRTWLTSYARAKALLVPLEDPINLGFGSMKYAVSGGSDQSTIAAAYFDAGIVNGEAGDLDSSDLPSCISKAIGHADNPDRVAWACEREGTGGAGGMGSGGIGGTGGMGSGGMGGTGSADIPCEEPGPGTIPAQDFRCGDLDDLAIALVGLHPPDVWLTRLEANLPAAALDVDFELRASLTQDEVAGRYIAPEAVNTPCEDGAFAPPPVTKPPRPNGGSGRTDRARWAMLSLLGLGLLAIARRRPRARAAMAHG